LSPTAPGFVLSGRSARAALPTALTEATVRSALRLSAGGAASCGMIPATMAHLMKGALRSMLVNRLKTAALVLLSAGVLSAGAGVLVGQERKDGPGAVPTAGGPAPQGEEKPGNRAESEPADQATIASLERRIRELELRLDEMAGPRPDGIRPAVQRPRIDLDTLRTIRPRLQCLVEKICVKAGQKVKKGDPLAELFSTDLIAAKNDFLAKNRQWKHDRKLFDLRENLVRSGAISNQLWVDTQNDEDKSRLDVLLARERLQFYGLSQREIDAVPEEDGEQKARFTLRSPLDGIVLEMGEVAAGDLCDPRSKLMVIAPVDP
jgi:multidrug efflux pump subunit AcrA (membrane-fusion protein)